MGLESLLDILKKAQESHPSFKLRLAEAEALERWKLAVGEVIEKHAKAIRVQNGVLWVEVQHPIWKSELHYRKQQILDILNGKATGANSKLTPPAEVLTDIYYLDFRPQSPYKPSATSGTSSTTKRVVRKPRTKT